MKKIIIAGNRDFTNYAFVKGKLETRDWDNTVIVSGAAKGVDSLGEKYAFEKGVPIRIFPAEWYKYGKSAGPIRNSQMANYADELIAFWNGKSLGTKNMIKQAREKGLTITVYDISKEY